MNKRNFKQYSAMTAITLTLAATGVQGITNVFAETSDDTVTQSPISGNPGKGLTVTPDSSDLDEAAGAAKKAGVEVTEQDTVTKTVSASEAAQAKKDAETSYTKQVAELKAKTEQQIKQDAAYNKSNDAYNAAMNKHQNETPVISGEKSGVAMKVYGDYDEANRGSYAYYDKFESTIDMSKVKNAVILKQAGWLSDSKLTIEKASDKKFYTKADVDKVNPNYAAIDTDTYIRNPKQGDIYRLSNAGIDSITSAKYDLIISPTATFPSTPASFLGFKQGAKQSLVVDVAGSASSRMTYYFVPHGAAANPTNAKTVAMTFVTSDIDGNQGGETNMGNIGVLNPKGSGVYATQPNSQGIVTYYDTVGETLEDSSATPRGTLGMFSVGNTFNWDFHQNHANKSMGGVTDGQYRYNLLGTGGTLNAAIKPDKPTPLTSTLQKTKIIVKPNVQKDVDAGANKTNIKGTANGQSFMAGDKITYAMKASDLPAGRDEYKTLAYTDQLPDGFKFDKASAIDANGTDVSKQLDLIEKDGVFTATFKPEYVAQINKDKAKSTSLPTIIVSGTTDKDHTTLKNVFDFVVDGDSYESNEVTNEVADITAHKNVEAGVKDTVTGNSIDGKSVAKGQVLTYELTTDDLPANRATDVKSFVWRDKLPKYVDLKSYKIVDANGEDVTDSYENKGDGKRNLNLVRKSTADMNADKTQVFKNDTVFITVVANEDGVNFKNQATNIINGGDRETNEVTNQTPSYHPEKQDVNDKGEDIDGKDVKPGDTIHYKVVGDLSDMTNMAITPDMLKQELFSISDDYDENKLSVTPEIQQNLSVQLKKSVTSDLNKDSEDQSNKDDDDTSGTTDNPQTEDDTTNEVSQSETDESESDTSDMEVQPTDGTIFIGKGTADEFDMNDVTVDWDSKNGRWKLTPKDNVEFLQKYAGNKLIITFSPQVKKGATGVVRNTAIQTTFGNEQETNTVKNPITDETVVTTTEKDRQEITHEKNVHNKTTIDTTSKESSSVKKVSAKEQAVETAPEKQLPTTGSNGPLQRIVNWFMGLAK